MSFFMEFLLKKKHTKTTKEGHCGLGCCQTSGDLEFSRLDFSIGHILGEQPIG